MDLYEFLSTEFLGADESSRQIAQERLLVASRDVCPGSCAMVFKNNFAAWIFATNRGEE